MKNMIAYGQAVEYNALNSINFVFNNDGEENAKIVFKNIFKTASKQIQIVDRNLNNDLTNSDEYISNLSCFLEKQDTKLDVLLEEAFNSTDNNKIHNLLKRFSNKIVVKKIPTGRFFKNSETGNHLHFCVADDKMYRIEYDIENRKAECNFNDSRLSTSLREIFYHVFKGNDVELCAL